MQVQKTPAKLCCKRRNNQKTPKTGSLDPPVEIVRFTPSVENEHPTPLREKLMGYPTEGKAHPTPTEEICGGNFYSNPCQLFVVTAENVLW